MHESDPKNVEHLTATKINEIYQKQKIDGQWTFSDEREHMDNLLCQRINFLLLAYALIVTGLATVQERKLFCFILISGLVLLVLMSWGIWRATAKFLIVVQLCYRIHNHPVYWVDQVNTHKSGKKESGHSVGRSTVYHKLGYWLPVVCILSLVLLLIMNLLHWIGPNDLPVANPQSIQQTAQPGSH